MHNEAERSSTASYDRSRCSFNFQSALDQPAWPSRISSGLPDAQFQYVWPDFLKTIVAVLSDGDLHGVDELRTQVISAHSIAPEQLTITQVDGQKSMFVNTVAQVFARLTATRAVVRQSLSGGVVAYKMTPKALSVVRRVGVNEVTIRHFSPAKTSKAPSWEVLFRLKASPLAG
jgi:hypothetical protein